MKNKNNNLPLILIILDGWGIAKPNKGNAITLSETPFINSLIKKYPSTELCAHGKCVGLPPEQDGNSEAGHMNIGAGRLVEQDVVKINKSIDDGTFFKNAAFITAIKHARDNNSNIHLMGMLSNGMSAHSDPDHLLALLTLLRKYNLNNAYLHLFTDGRDSPKYVSLKLIETIKREYLDKEQIATVMGRFYAMDRKKKWKRTERAYNSLVIGSDNETDSPEDAITQSYNKGENDEFIEPYIIKKNKKALPRIQDNDSVIFFNLRSDRARQLAKIFVQKKFNEDNPCSYKRRKVLKNLCFVAMTDFGPDLDSIITAFPSIDIKETLPMVLSDLRQLYITETEKYAHVTYFFNGGYSGKVDNEDHHVIISPDVRSYDVTPAMKSEELSHVVINNLVKDKYDFTVLNFAAPDMIAHTGNLQAGIKCCEIINKELEKIIGKYLKYNGTLIITADHGNIEEMINLDTKEIDTEHSSNPVPFIIIGNNIKNLKLKKGGRLSDIAPTILNLLGRIKPAKMTGRSLIKTQ